MRTRYFSFLALAIAAGFLVVASQAFAAPAIAGVALGVGIGMGVCSVGIVLRFHRHIPSLVAGALTALVSAWMIIASQVFSLGTVQDLTFAEALGIVGISIAALTAHELSTERVVHSLALRTADASDYEEHVPQRSDRMREPIAG